jgi:hypothetical protein
MARTSRPDFRVEVVTRIIGVSGSLCARSLNAALLRAAAGFAPAGVAIEIESAKGIPLYDGDLESSSGLPAAVTALKDRIAAVNGLPLVIPEYNNSLAVRRFRQSRRRRIAEANTELRSGIC